MIKAIFLDRDGIINSVIMRGSEVGSPRFFHEFRVRNDFLLFYSEAQLRELELFVVSNQPDIKRGLLEQAELNLMTELLRQQFQFREIVYCLHDDSADCTCRKPKPGMILNLMGKYKIKSHEALLIGDSNKDILAARSAGVCSIFLRQQHNLNVSVASDYTVNSLSEVFLLEKGCLLS